MGAYNRRLQDTLQTIAGAENKVYFQPPDGMDMKYPCIVYKLDDIEADHADDALYRHMNRYLITIMTEDSDSSWPYEILAMPMSKFVNSVNVKGLIHTNINLYFNKKKEEI